MKPHELPVYKQKTKILNALEKNQVIVVESPTGSGKTTQLPVILYEAGFADKGTIGVTQPRRIAAVSVCEYIANQLGRTIPDTVGYKMRFEDKTDETTKIKIMTDGILLQELKTDRYLSKYNVIMVDEAHERSLNIDFILGLLKYVLEVRKDFKVIISSATINAEIFSEYFGGAPMVYIDAEMYPVGIVYDPPPEEEKYEGMINKIVEIVSRIDQEKREGDILIFLSGEKQIKDCIQLLASMPFSKRLYLMPLYGRLSKEEQERVFIETPKGKTKVVVSTNIAETSVTIDGITSVIDSGLAKLNYYNPRTYTSSLVETAISKASSNQRKGRAGRTRPGTCYRLYTKRDYQQRPMYTLEEIYRTDLSEVVLRMAEIGILDYESFDFISPPGREGLISAIQTLNMLHALNEDRTLSDIGRMMAVFPLLPRLSRIIMEAVHRYPDVLEESLIAVSFLSTKSPFLLPQGEEIEARKAHHSFQHPSGDFISYLQLFRSFEKCDDYKIFCEQYYLDERTMGEIVNIKRQLEEIVSDMGIPITSGGSIMHYLCAVSTGLIQFVCERSRKNSYRSLTADRIHIHPGSVMFRETPRYIVAGEIVRTSKMFARSVSPLKREWLPEISDLLAKHLSGKKGAAPGRKPAPKADSEPQIQTVFIGSENFPVSPYKGKRFIVELPWEKLSSMVETGRPRLTGEHRKLKGKIVFGNREILTGEKLSTILKVAPLLSPETELVKNWPKGKQFHIPEQLDELCAKADLILKLCPAKGKSKKRLGYISLNTDAIGTFWFTCSKGFHNALSQSLASLEVLIDVLDTEHSQLERLNDLYRKLSDYFEQVY